MKRKLTALEKMLLASVSFTILLMGARIIYAKDFVYCFYLWNLFLAVVPLLFSRQLKNEKKFLIKNILLLTGWLLFFPNAPYLITDIFHFQQRPPMPYWYDLLLVMSGAWNGLVLGIISLMQVEAFLSKLLKRIWVKVSMFSSFLLCGYGVYIGRFLRFNSWDIVTAPKTIIRASAHHFITPQYHLQLWGFTFAFALLFGLIYFTLKNLPKYFMQKNNF